MKKIEIKNEKEIVKTLHTGRIVEGRLGMALTEDGCTVIEFVAYNRNAKHRKKDITICELESGWLKESPKKYKLFSSVKNDLPYDRIEEAMQRDLNIAMEHLAVHLGRKKREEEKKRKSEKGK